MGIETMYVSSCISPFAWVAIDGECRWALKPGQAHAEQRAEIGRGRLRMPCGIGTIGMPSRAATAPCAALDENAEGQVGQLDQAGYALGLLQTRAVAPVIIPVHRRTMPMFLQAFHRPSSGPRDHYTLGM